MVMIRPLSLPCLYSELFWSAFSRIWTEYGEIWSISPYSAQMRENTNQSNSEYGHFLRSAFFQNSPGGVRQNNLFGKSLQSSKIYLCQAPRTVYNFRKKDTITVYFLWGEIQKIFRQCLFCGTFSETFRLVRISLWFFLTNLLDFLCRKR